jgi:hypothetical protein
MSGASVCTNPARAPYIGNNDRPGGASALGQSLDPEVLRHAIETGNRQTRRLARQTLARVQRKHPHLNKSPTERTP